MNPVTALDARTLLWIAAALSLLLAMAGPASLRRRRDRSPFRRRLWVPQPETLFFAGLFGAFLLATIATRT